MQTSRRIGWKVAKLSLNVASVRYRALLPVLALKDVGEECRVFADYDTANLDGLDVLVIVKGLYPNDLELVKAASARGIQVVLDLCDCIFVANYGGTIYNEPPAKVFLEMAKYASAIVVPTEPLASVVRRETANRLPVVVIPDGIDSAELQAQAVRVLEESIAIEAARRPTPALKVHRPNEPQHKGLTRIRKKISRKYKKVLNFVRSEGFAALGRKHAAKCAKIISRITGSAPKADAVVTQNVSAASMAESTTAALSPQKTDPQVVDTAKRIMWFGNHGATYAKFGMLDLLDIRTELEDIASKMDVKLVVISDNLDKYKQNILPLKIKSEYIAWNPTVVEQEFARASVVVIPNPLGMFSICKSANRAVLALKHGVPVVATSTSALQPLESCIVLDDFAGGLKRYLSDSSAAQKDVLRGQQLIEELFGQEQTRRSWQEVLHLAMTAAKPKSIAA